MNLFKELNERRHEQVSFFHDPNSGLKGIVAIHNTVLGPWGADECGIMKMKRQHW